VLQATPGKGRKAPKIPKINFNPKKTVILNRFLVDSVINAIGSDP